MLTDATSSGMMLTDATLTMLLTIAFVLIVYLLWRTSNLGSEIDNLQYTVRMLQRATDPHMPEPAPAHKPTPPPLPLQPPPPPPLPPPPPPVIVPAPFVVVEEEEEEEEPVFATPLEPAPQQRNWEEAIGGNWLNKIGAVILVIGIALFLGYSFASMGPLGRTLTASALGLSLLTSGLWLERKESLKVFAYGFIASGWATLYFTAYAAHAVEAAKVIESPVVGMVLMVAASCAMVAHSLRYRKEALTALAYACVYAALALSEINTAVVLSLFPLAVSMFWISRRLEWTYTTLFSACATYAVFLSRGSTGAPLYVAESLLLGFWLMFELMDLTQPSITFAVNALAGLGAGAYIWQSKSPETMWIFCSVAAVLYLASAILRAITKQDERPALAISAVMTGLAIFAQTDGLWTAIFLALEAEALFLAGIHFERQFIQVLSYLAFGVSVATMPWSEPTRLPGLLVHACAFYFNRALRPRLQAFGYIATALASIAISLHAPLRFAGLAFLGFAAVLFELGYRKMLAEFRHQAYATALFGGVAAIAYRLHPDYIANPWIPSAAALLAFAMLIRATKFLAGLPEVESLWIRRTGSASLTALTAAALSSMLPQAWWGVAWFAAAVVLLELGIRKLPEELVFASLPLMFAGILSSTLPVAEHQSLAMCAISALAMLRLLFSEDAILRSIRSGMLATAAIFGYFAMWQMLPHQWIPVVLAVAALALAELGSYAKANDLIIGEMVIVAIAAVLAVFQRPMPWTTALPLVAVHHALAFRHKQQLQTWAATAIAGVWMWTTLNPWTCAALAALSVATLLLGEKEQSYLCMAAAIAFAIFGTGVPPVALTITLAFVLASLFLNKEAEVRTGYACVLAASAATMLFQHAQGGMLTLSLGGLGVTLLALGFTATERPLRLSGLAVLLLCILKLFVYDLSSLETIYRIVSFIGLGMILLAVSWVYTRYKSLF